MDHSNSALTWFQVPAADFRRAVNFYNAVLQTQLREETMADETMGLFPYQEGGVGGAVTLAPYLKPGENGTNVFLLVKGELNEALDRVAKAGGKLLTPKTELPGMGHYAVIRDTEGNRIGLHSPN
jgi:predicted enzyme related to lactoylglutathione lyase